MDQAIQQVFYKLDIIIISIVINQIENQYIVNLICYLNQKFKV